MCGYRLLPDWQGPYRFALPASLDSSSWIRSNTACAAAARDGEIERPIAKRRQRFLHGLPDFLDGDGLELGATPGHDAIPSTRRTGEGPAPDVRHRVLQHRHRQVGNLGAATGQV